MYIMDGHIYSTKCESICFVVKFSQPLSDKEMIYQTLNV